MNKATINDIMSIADFLGEERMEKLKDFIVEKLMKNIDGSINQRWFVLPDEFQNTMYELAEQCREQIIKKYRKKLTDAAEQRVNEMIDELKGEKNGAK